MNNKGAVKGSISYINKLRITLLCIGLETFLYGLCFMIIEGATVETAFKAGIMLSLLVRLVVFITKKKSG